MTIQGTVALPPLPLCRIGTGSIWSIDKGAVSLHSTALAGGGSTAFGLTTTVARGQTLYFIHDPGDDSFCDTALVSLTISAT